MFQKSISTAALLALFAGILPASAENEAATDPAAAIDPLPALTNEQMVEAFGYFSVFQMGIKQLGFGAAEGSAIARGFTQALADESPSPEMMAVVQSPAFQQFMQERMEEARQAAEAEAAAAGAGNIEAGKAFIEGLKSDKAVQSTASGLHYKIIEDGAEEKPAMTDSVLVHYKGTRIDGTQFDSSYDRGEPATFPLKGVVPGFGEGLTKIGAGGKIILYIPSDLGYGNTPRPGGAIQPGDTLVFECELIEVNPGS